MEQQFSKNNNISVPKLSKYFSLIVAILPILATYASGILGLSVADVCLVLFVMISMLKRGSRNQYAVPIFSLLMGLMLIFLLTMVSCLLGFPSNVSDVVIRIIRYGFYIAVLFTACKKILDIPSLVESVKNISFIGSVFIIFQTVTYYVFGIVIKGFVSFLPLYTEQYQNLDYIDVYESLGMYRPTSFFLEPAHYARYCIIGIILYLFVDQVIDSKSVFRAVLCMLGIIVSTSTQGYLMLGLVILIFFFTRIKHIESRILRLLIGFAVIMLPLIFFGILQLPVVQLTLKRSFSGSILDSNTAIGGRLSGYMSYFKLPTIKKLIGTGFGNVPDGVWLSSAAYWLYGSGIFVFVIYIYFLLRAFFCVGLAEKSILLIVLLLFFTDDSFYSYMIVLYFSLVIFRPISIQE